MRLYAKKEPRNRSARLSQNQQGVQRGAVGLVGVRVSMGTLWTNNITCGSAEAGTPPYPPGHLHFDDSSWHGSLHRFSAQQRRPRHGRTSQVDSTKTLTLGEHAADITWRLEACTCRYRSWKRNIFRRLFLERLNPVLPPQSPGSRPF